YRFRSEIISFTVWLYRVGSQFLMVNEVRPLPTPLAASRPRWLVGQLVLSFTLSEGQYATRNTYPARRHHDRAIRREVCACPQTWLFRRAVGRVRYEIPDTVA